MKENEQKSKPAAIVTGDMRDLGQAYIDLGRALQDDKTTLTELSDLALRVGAKVRIGIQRIESGGGD